MECDFDTGTVITGNIVGHSVRLLRNQLTTDYISLEKNLVFNEINDLEPLDQLTTGSLRRVVEDGEAIRGPMIAGQIFGPISE